MPKDHRDRVANEHPIYTGYTRAQVDYIRSLGTEEEDVYEMLVLHLALRHKPEEAKEMIAVRREQSYCPHCGKEFDAGKRARQRNKHINSCAKLQSQRIQIQASETTQPATPQHLSSSPSSLSSSSSSPSCPSTSATSTSLSSPSPSPKRKIDDAEQSSTHDEHAEVPKQDDSKADRSDAPSPSKRPRLCHISERSPVVGNASYNNQPGEIAIDTNHHFITWHPETRVISPEPATIISMTNIKEQYKSSKIGPTLQIFAQEPLQIKDSSYLFSFASSNDGEDQKNAIFNVLLPTFQAARIAESSVGTAGNFPAPEVDDAPAISSTGPAAEPALASDLDTSTIRPSGDRTARVEGAAAEAADEAEEDDGIEEEFTALEEEERVEDESQEDVEWEQALQVPGQAQNMTQVWISANRRSEIDCAYIQ